MSKKSLSKKTKSLIKDIEKFKTENDVCYLYVEGTNGFYNSAFVLPVLKSNEEVVLHNGANEDLFEIYEIISNKEFSKRIKFMIGGDINRLVKLDRESKNYVFSHYSEFKKCNGILWNN